MFTIKKRVRTVLAAMALLGTASTAGAANYADATLSAMDSPRRAEFARQRASSEVRHVADWVVESGDNGHLPFALIDKVNARIFVFDAAGRIRGTSPVLLGLARGDDSVPGIGERKMSEIRPDERTTPAGRFVAERGRNLNGEDIFWIDYDAAVSMHRVRANNARERRLERLATPTAGDNRISYGCVNVPARFYNEVIDPAFTPAAGIIYVLPEARSAREVFGARGASPTQNRRAANVR
ncbi:MAG: hypothetical protein H7X76_01970 [Prolixibacteraceae bacterium]|nr:hypothetical protein [Burkholderiales bacterium]